MDTSDGLVLSVWLTFDCLSSEDRNIGRESFFYFGDFKWRLVRFHNSDVSHFPVYRSGQRGDIHSLTCHVNCEAVL